MHSQGSSDNFHQHFKSENNFIYEALNDHFLIQLYMLPTRENNILDLVITTVPEHVKITNANVASHSHLIIV